MPKRVLRVGLHELDKAVAEVERMERSIKDGVNHLVTLLSQAGVEIASAKLMAYGAISTGELDISLRYLISEDGRRGIIRTDSDHAAFVEFGTGVRGASAPHPTLPWAYDIHGHGDSGWWYPTDATDPNPTKRQAPDGSFWAWTKGMPSRPFMYDTARELADRVAETAREVFKT